MAIKFLFGLFAITSVLMACAQSDEKKDEPVVKDYRKNLDSLQVAYFASGCFWCVEEVFESVNGVEEVISGYSGGKEKNPTYEQVGAGVTGHAESVKIYYDSSVVNFQTLVDVFFNSHDPTTKDQQGPDKGRQYRSIAFYQNEDEKEIIESTIKSLLKNDIFPKITTEVTAFTIFYPAEDYHQDYVKLHPNQAYVKAVSIPRLNEFKEKMPEVLKP